MSIVWHDDWWTVAATPDLPGAASYVVPLPGLIGVGEVRLDNRVEVWHRLRRTSRVLFGEETDLHLATLALREFGIEYVAQLLGDFGFVILDTHRRIVMAARDAFGVKPLFVSEQDGSLMLSSRADLLTRGGYDDEFVGEFLLGQSVANATTIYRDVARLPHGSWIEWNDIGLRRGVYWRPQEISQRDVDENAAQEEFRDLLANAVCCRLAGSGPIWAELSGGLDTSSVVVIARELARDGRAPPLGGTLTYVDTLGEGDEREYVDAVVSHTGVRNERFYDDWPWRDDGTPPPLTDEPSPQYPFFARQRRMYDLLATVGARVLLGGHGADHYLGGGNLSFIADLLIHRHVARAVRSTVGQAQAWGTSFWRAAWPLMIVPLLPRRLRLAAAPEEVRLPTWIDRRFARQHELTRLLPGQTLDANGAIDRYRGALCRELSGLPNVFSGRLLPQDVELRYPFLCRDLVEFVISLTPEYVVKRGQSKMILREALRTALPEKVRGRRTKGSIDARFVWSLQREHGRLAHLLRESILADHGCIDLAKLRTAVEAARCGFLPNTAFLLSALALETWLAVRAGRWSDQVPNSNPFSRYGSSSTTAQVGASQANRFCGEPIHAENGLHQTDAR